MGLPGNERNGKVVNVNDATIKCMQRDDAEIISAAFSAAPSRRPALPPASVTRQRGRPT
jgi:hypothetical protein